MSALAGAALVDPASVGRLNQAFRLLRFVLERQLDLGPVDEVVPAPVELEWRSPA